MNRRNIILIIILALFMLALPISWSGNIRSWIKQAVTPITGALYESSGSVRKVIITLKDLNRLPSENEDLANQVANLVAENTRLKNVDRENLQLKSELNYVTTIPNLKLVGAKIVARGSLSLAETVTIDHGSEAGIKVGQPVAVAGALVGKVLSVSAHTADVELATSSTAITQVQLQSSRANGVLRGGISGLVIDYISQDIQINPGEVVVTSGLGGNLRQGLVVGTIINVSSKKNDIYQSATVKPVININRVDLVFVEVQW
jgi:rod shape-determining protein MreC